MKSVALACAMSVIAMAAVAQSPSVSFADLRSDGNGIAALRTPISSAIDGQTAGQALTAIAGVARLNITFDPGISGLATKVAIPAHARSAAEALLEVGRLSRLSLRVSPSGQIIVVASPPTKSSVASDTSRPANPPVSLPAVRTEAMRLERQQFETSARMGSVSVTGAELRNTPVFIEPDVMRSVQLLPGIESRSDWSAGFTVRGGEPDQNLILLDGYPIYDPFHLGGLFSTFIDPMVGRVDLRTGNMPVQFGGRLSGALDVRSAEPASSDVGGTAEVSLVSSVASIGKSFGDGTGSWMVAARRTYADAIVNLFQRDAFPYHFQDFQAHVTRALGANTRVSITAYDGADIASGTNNPNAGGHWGNAVLGATLTHAWRAPVQIGGVAIGDSVTFEQRASVTRFDALIDGGTYLLHGRSDVSDARASGSLAVHGSRLTQTVGYELVRQSIGYDAFAAVSSFGDLIPLDSAASRMTSASAYVDERWRPIAALLIEAGARADAVRSSHWVGLEPRLSAKYFLGASTAITVGGGSYAQWMHSLGRSEEPIRLMEFWVGTPPTLPISRARDITLGVEHWLGPSRLVHVEGYTKRYSNLLIPNTNSDPKIPGDELTPTTGISYGLDFLIRQLEGGPFSGWASYSYAFNTRVGPDGVRYYPTQDRRHTLNLVGNWHIESFALGGRIGAASGLPTTAVLGEFLRNQYDPVTQRWTPAREVPTEQNIPGEYNSARLPWYFRADVSASRTGHLFGRQASAYLSIVNLLNAHNPAGYLYAYSGRPSQASFPNLPFVPTFGVSIVY